MSDSTKEKLQKRLDTLRARADESRKSFDQMKLLIGKPINKTAKKKLLTKGLSNLMWESRIREVQNMGKILGVELI